MYINYVHWFYWFIPGQTRLNHPTTLITFFKRGYPIVFIKSYLHIIQCDQILMTPNKCIIGALKYILHKNTWSKTCSLDWEFSESVEIFFKMFLNVAKKCMNVKVFWSMGFHIRYRSFSFWNFQRPIDHQHKRKAT